MKPIVFLMVFFIVTAVGCASSHISVTSQIPKGQNIDIHITTTDSE